MANYDFYLGEGDTAPVLRMQLLVPVSSDDPLYASSPNGVPADLTGATIEVVMRLADDATAPLVTKTATVDGDPLDGWILFEWDGYLGKVYNCRVKVLQNNGKRLSFLNDRLFTLFVSPDP